jgi:hypothetical protein
MSRVSEEWRKLRPFFSLLDFEEKPRSRVGWLVRVLVMGGAAWLLWGRLVLGTRTLLSTRAPLPIPTEELDDYRFRLPERTRKEIFAKIAVAEDAERQRAIREKTWVLPGYPNGHQWSREDDRGHYERVGLRNVAAEYRISLSQAYLILDEGIRARWPGPNGEPLPGTSPPLDPRTGW